MTQKDKMIWAEMARRKKQFHAEKNWKDIRLWGLFSLGMVSHLIKKGELITDMKKENKTIWVRPSTEAYEKHILPILNRSLKSLTEMAGWSR